jgi:hypothetical protein
MAFGDCERCKRQFVMRLADSTLTKVFSASNRVVRMADLRTCRDLKRLLWSEIKDCR